MNEDVIQKLEEVVKTLRNNETTEKEDESEWHACNRTWRTFTTTKDKFIVRFGSGQKATFPSYESAREWIEKDIKSWREGYPEHIIDEYAIDVVSTETIEFIVPKKRKEYKGTTDVWVE